MKKCVLKDGNKRFLKKTAENEIFKKNIAKTVDKIAGVVYNKRILFFTARKERTTMPYTASAMSNTTAAPCSFRAAFSRACTSCAAVIFWGIALAMSVFVISVSFFAVFAPLAVVGFIVSAVLPLLLIYGRLFTRHKNTHRPG